MNSALSPQPVQLPPNYVWRSYLGGRELRRFRGSEPGADDHVPEDWIASTVRARNGENQQREDEGISRLVLDGKEVSLPDLLRSQPEWFWGPSGPPAAADQTGVLLKFLDSSTRLHIQAHPDRHFVQQHFGGNAGKTECWYILATRGEGYVYLGFQHAPSVDEWTRIVLEQDLEAMLGCFDKIPVKPGDCFVVPAGTPHAIGEGILMVELQEPTDWVVRCEFEVGGHRLPEAARYMGLTLEQCLPIFDYTAYSPAAVRERFFQAPRELRKEASFVEEEIIQPPWHEFFRLRRFRGSGAVSFAGGSPMVLMALKGGGVLHSSGGPVSVSAGQTWLLPGAAAEWNWDADVESEWLLAEGPVA